MSITTRRKRAPFSISLSESRDGREGRGGETERSDLHLFVYTEGGLSVKCQQAEVGRDHPQVLEKERGQDPSRRLQSIKHAEIGFQIRISSLISTQLEPRWEADA